MKNLPKFVPYTVLTLAVGLMLGACKNATPQMGAGAPGPFEVNTVTIAAQELRPTVELSGRTAAYRVAEVRPQVSGIVQKRLFTEGSEVKAGELLYQIDPATYQATFTSAEAALAKTEAQEYSARLKAGRYRELVKTRAVSEQEQVDAEAGWKQAVAEIAAAKAAVANARINLNHTRITAPIAGRIGKSMVSEGALVTAQQATALAIIQQLDPLYIDVSQSSNELLQLKKKLTVGKGQQTGAGKTEVKVVLDGDVVYPETGNLEFSDVTVDQSTGTVTVRAVVGNPQQELLPGMFVRARVTSAESQKVVLAPQASIVRNNRGQAMVMLVDAKSMVEARPVETGENLGEQIVITKGLSAGDQLIVAGLQKIKPGMPVKIAAPQPAADTKNTPAAQTSAKKAE